ncbi:MAG TPA: metal-dependent hydrolase [Thermodesulfobacteriota bacterium]|nr:metal-dependent hydrolase [Thermodesulfobacteriota bacterium]
MMPLPIGHAAIGFTTYSFCNGNESGSRLWKVLTGILILSNLPDVDVLFGIVFTGNGNVFHRGPTHSLIFALIAGLLAHGVCRLWSQLPKLSFRVCFLLILSHILADSLLSTSPISFFWPVTVNWSTGHSGIGDVINLVLFGNDRDGKIMIGCASLILLHRTLMAVGILSSVRKLKSVFRAGSDSIKRNL